MSAPGSTVMAREAFASLVTTKRSVSDYLMVETWREASKTWVLSDGSVMQLVEVGWFAATHLSNQELEGVTRAVGRALGRVEDQVAVQITVMPSVSLDEEFEAYLTASDGDEAHPVLRKLEESRVRFLQRSTAVPLFYTKNGQAQFRTKIWRVILAVIARPTVALATTTPNVATLLGDLFRKFTATPQSEESRRLTGVMEKFRSVEVSLIEACRISTARICEALDGQGIRTMVIEPQRFLRLMRTMLYPDWDQEQEVSVSYDPTQHFAGQVPVGSMTVDLPHGVLASRAEVAFKTLTLTNFRREWLEPGMISQPLEVLGGDISLLGFLTEGWLTINARAIPTEEAKELARKYSSYISKRLVTSEKAAAIEADCRTLMGTVESGGRVFQAEFIAVVSGAGANQQEAMVQAEAKARALATQFSVADLEMFTEDYAAPSFFFRSLPGGYCPAVEEEQRFHYLPDTALAALIPFARGSRGVTGPAQCLWHNRDGELVRVNALDAVPSHQVTTGMPGQGKSVGTTINLLHALREKAQVFYLDRGFSFQPAVEMLGDAGAFYDARPESRTGVRFNIFEGTRDQAWYALNAILPHLAVPVPTDPLSNDDLAALKEAIQATYTAKQITDVAYRTERDLSVYGGDTFVDSAWKHMAIAPVTEQVRAKFAKLCESDPVSADLYRIAIITRKRLPLRPGQTTVEFLNLSTVGDLSTEDVQWFVSRDCILRTAGAVGEAERAVEVLVPATDQRIGEIASGHFEHQFTDRWEARVGFRDDVRALVNIGVQFIVPDHMATALRTVYRDEYRANPEYSAATDAQIDDLVERRMAKASGVDFCDAIEGRATIQQLVIFRDLYEELSRRGADGDQQAARLAQRFQEYVGNGPKAKYFDGTSTLRYDGKLAVSLETGDMADKDPHMFVAIAASFFQATILYSQRKENRRHPKYLPCDESWQLLNLPNAMAWIENIGRTGRKFRLYVNMISQAVTDFSERESGRMALKMSQIRVYFSQAAEAFPAVQKDLHLSDQMIALLQSVKTVPGYYSECVYDIQTVTGRRVFEVLRIILTPEEYWVCTTDGEDVPVRSDLIADLEARGMNRADAIAAAIDTLAKKYPRGVKVARREAQTTA